MFLTEPMTPREDATPSTLKHYPVYAILQSTRVTTRQMSLLCAFLYTERWFTISINSAYMVAKFG